MCLYEYAVWEEKQSNVQTYKHQLSEEVSTIGFWNYRSLLNLEIYPKPAPVELTMDRNGLSTEEIAELIDMCIQIGILMEPMVESKKMPC